MSNDPAHPAGAALSLARRGVMLVLSSPSGAGKTTLAKMLIKAEANASPSVSATTRPPRPGETDGEDYHFLDRAAFEAQRDGGVLLEWAEVFGHLYGTPRQAVETAIGSGRDVIFDIDWQGARQLYANAPGDVVRVFILPPSRAVLEARLKGRGSDAADVVAKRLAGAALEVAHWTEYDYVIVNADRELSLASLRAILAAERCKRERNPDLPALVAELIAAN